eukprot:417769-Pleurochrysis_carterae.AAC.1
MLCLRHAGKSTVSALLTGLYACDAGGVLIDGERVDSLDGLFLRQRCVSVVPQEPALLSGSLRSNVALGRYATTRRADAAVARDG